MTGTFLVMSGDSLTDVDLTGPRRGPPGATAASPRWASPRSTTQSQYGVVVTRRRRPRGRFPGEARPRRGALARSATAASTSSNRPSSIASRRPRSTTSASRSCPNCVADGLPFHAHVIDGYWSDVGDLREYRRGNFDALDRSRARRHARREVRPGLWVGEGTTIAASARHRTAGAVGRGLRRRRGGDARRPAGDRRRDRHRRRRPAARGHHVDRGSSGRRLLRSGRHSGHQAQVHADAQLEATVVGAHAVVGAGSVVGAVRLEPCTRAGPRYPARPGRRVAPAWAGRRRRGRDPASCGRGRPTPCSRCCCPRAASVAGSSRPSSASAARARSSRSASTCCPRCGTPRPRLGRARARAGRPAWSRVRRRRRAGRASSAVVMGPPTACAVCVGAGFAFASARSAFLYRGAARELVSSFKHGGQRCLGPTMAGLAAERFRAGGRRPRAGGRHVGAQPWVGGAHSRV